MKVAGLERPELVLMCAYMVRNGLAKGSVDAINKFANGSITAEEVSAHAHRKANTNMFSDADE